jgi:hypothetical protein
MTEQPPRCRAELHHAHGTAVCDLPDGHDGDHGALCDVCEEDGYDDPSDRLEWKVSGEDWTAPKAVPADTSPTS